MAESIYTLLDGLMTETSVPGASPKMQSHTLPREMFPCGDQFADEAKLLQWATENGILHAVLQKGIKAHVIDCRARFKASLKGDVWTPEYGQKNVDSYTWKVQTKPEGKQTKEQIVKEFLAGMTPEELQEFLSGN